MGILLLIICSLTVFEQINGAILNSIVPDIVKDTSVSNERFNGIIGSLHNFGDLAGPPLAGLVITLVGSSMSLVLDGVTFLISSFILFIFIKFVPATPHRDNDESTFDGLKESFSFIVQNPKTRYLIMPSMLVNILVFPLLILVLPYLAKTSFNNAIGLGFMMSFFGAGALLSSLAFTAIGERLQKLWLLIFCTLTLMSCFSLAGFANRAYTFTALLFFVGLCVGLMGPLDDTILQTSAPEQIRGRVFLVYSNLRFVMIPLAMVIFGFLLDHIH